MALTRGFGGKCPCPICLVSPEDLADLSKICTLRTAQTMRSTLERACEEQLAREKEAVLKSVGLRGVEVNTIFSCTYYFLTPFCRTSFGRSKTPIPIARCLLTGYMRIVQVYGATICGLKCKDALAASGEPQSRKLTSSTSVLLIYLCRIYTSSQSFKHPSLAWTESFQ